MSKDPKELAPKAQMAGVCVCFPSSLWKRFLVPIHILIHIPF